MRLAPGSDSVIVLPLEFNVSQSLDSATLTAQREHNPRETTMGLTTARSHSRVDIHLRGMKLPGSMCVRADVTMEVGYAPVAVIVARDLDPGGCQYREVLAHEMRHVAVLRAHLEEARGRLAATLTTRLAPSAIYRFASMDQAAVHFTEGEQEQLAALARDELDSVAAEQQAIDTPDEYERLTHVCGAAH